MEIKEFKAAASARMCDYGVEIPIRVHAKITKDAFAETRWDAEYVPTAIVFATETVTRWQWPALEYILMHEIAHALAGPEHDHEEDQWHGPQFVKTCDKIGAHALPMIHPDFLDVLDDAETLDR